MQNIDITAAETAWSSLAGKIYVPHSEEEYRRLVALLDSFLDEVGENETHPLASLMEVVGVLIEKYEDEHVPELSDVLQNKNYAHAAEPSTSTERVRKNCRAPWSYSRTGLKI